MSHRRAMRAMATGVVLAIGVLVAGCSSDEPGPEPTQTSTSPATSEPSPTETALTPDEEARAALTGAVTAYYAMSDLLGSDATTDLNRSYEVAQDQAAEFLITGITDFRDNRFRQTGTTTVADVLVQQLDLSTSAGTPSTSQVQVCADVTDADLVDETGQSVISPDRPDRFRQNMTLRSAAGPAGPWVVTVLESAGETC